jgi:hypothetical protein
MALVASEMTNTMQEAMTKEWEATREGSLPDIGKEDRRLLFAAVARGLLEYLKANESELLQSITIHNPAGNDIVYPIKNVVIDEVIVER